MMLNYSKFLTTCLAAVLIFSMSACDKEDMGQKTALFSPDYKSIQVNTGFVDNGIEINAKEWSVAYVKDALSGEILQDVNDNPVVLNAAGTVEVAGGWLKLEKIASSNLLNLTLKENFNAEPRKFVIGIAANGTEDELSFTQSRGAGYEIVKKEIIEVPGSRKEFTSDEGCYTITLSNNTSAAKNMETLAIFKDVNYMSEFSSTDEDAFKWINAQDSLIFMGEILKDGATYWSKQVPYKEGKFFEPYINSGSKQTLLVQPYSNIQVKGEIRYLTRECQYTFTIKNQSSGHLFDVSGTWKQKVPLLPITKIF
ncbi:hypothetical protein HCX49_06380 [Sphingobacterium kitahiroshimense]|uniref:hypothetical protein n=1 Tax=Sphingobacterium sp. B16(2022) TaxID=2914044 RepID=UPI00143A9091|nr:hypothetical protein [Sphingobacterium sp. B16(2022)]NJI72825.1 hypothetical protein [Sphingobacterium sp. B16(2022)]